MAAPATALMPRFERGRKVGSTRRWIIAAIAGLAVLATMPAVAQRAQDEGVKVGRPSFVRKLVSAEKLEKAAQQQYVQLQRQATSRSLLLPPQDAQVQRVQRIAQALLPHAGKWNDRAKDWRWEISVLKSRTVNAFCMPGGKIAVFTGIIESLNLTDDELAMIIGHEIAHALREHARERAAKRMLTNVGAVAVALLVGGGAGDLARTGGSLLNLRFSRDDEREADLIGMELAARAGYNPESGITLWQKMAQVAKTAPPSWLSTHPSSDDRIQRIKAALKDVTPLYERARAARPRDN